MAAALAPVPLIAAKATTSRLDTDIGSILGYILVGLIVGLLARLLVPGRDSVGLRGTLVIGVVGAVLGWWLAGASSGDVGGRLARFDRRGRRAGAARTRRLTAQAWSIAGQGSDRGTHRYAAWGGSSRRSRLPWIGAKRVPSQPAPAWVP